MASSTFKGRYEECYNCIHQFYDEVKKRDNCKYSHNMIRKNANGVGVKYERQFKYCGLKKIKGEIMSSYQKSIEILTEVTQYLELKCFDVDNITIYEGYIDFNFEVIKDSVDFYEYLLWETNYSSDRDESRNAFLVRIFY